EQALNAQAARIRNDIKELRAPDDYTVEVETHRPFPYLPYLFSPQLLTGSGLIFSKKHLVESAGTDFEAQSKVLNEHPIGSGPFEFVSHTRGTSRKYRALEEHWRNVPTIAELEF